MAKLSTYFIFNVKLKTEKKFFSDILFQLMFQVLGFRSDKLSHKKNFGWNFSKNIFIFFVLQYFFVTKIFDIFDLN